MNRKTVSFTATIELDIPESLSDEKTMEYIWDELEKLHINGVDSNVFASIETFDY